MVKENDLIRMTRSRLYVLLDSFENDMRGILRRFVTSDMSESEALGNLYDKAAQRRAEDDGSTDDTPAAAYLDLMEAYEILNRHRRLLPEELAGEVRHQTESIPRLVDARKRVMHPRPLLADDSQTVTFVLGEFRSQWWPELHRTLSQLLADPVWDPQVNLKADVAPTLHNLPLPDYDETGLLGRDDEVAKITALIKRKREPVITITGEGGIGKTALALFVAFSLVDDPARPFDAILWASMKHEKLTAQGVQAITGAARDIAGSAKELGHAFDKSFDGSVDQLAEALSGIEALVILDNLETISGDEFGVLYNTLPDSVTYLVTSRIGIGQYERRYPLRELGESAALRLLNDHIRFRRVESLTRISGDTRRAVVNKLRRSPLGIIWFVLAVESGREPVSLIKGQGELLEFCVRSVYDNLTQQARMVLDSLAVIRRPAGADELVVITGESIDAVNLAVQELERGSLVRREPGAGGDLRMVVSLTETASTFLDRRVSIDAELSREISTREREFRLNEERRQSDASSRSLNPVVIHARGPQDKAASFVLRKAFLAAREGDFQQGASRLAEARLLDPDFWEVDRVEAFIRIYQEDYAGASSSYQSALSKAEGDDRGIVAHFYARHLSKNMHDPKRAEEFAFMAHSLLNSGETALGLGNILVRRGEFEKGLGLIRGMLGDATGRLRVMGADSYAGGLRRWGEWCGREERNPVAQYAHASTGAKIALEAIEAGLVDDKLRNTACRAALTALEGLVASHTQGLIPKGVEEWLDRIASGVVRMIGAPSWEQLAQLGKHLSGLRPAIPGARRLSARIQEYIEPSSSQEAQPSVPLVGEIVQLQAAYGFIRHPRFPDNLFFHRDNCDIPSAWGALRIGELVSFRTEENERGFRAVRVAPSPTPRARGI